MAFPSLKADLIFAVLLSSLILGSVFLIFLVSGQLIPHPKASAALPSTPVLWVLQANLTYYQGEANVSLLFNNFMTVNLTIIKVLINGVPVEPLKGQEFPTVKPGPNRLNFTVTVPSSLYLAPGEKVDLTLILTHNVTVSVQAYVNANK